MKRNGFTLLELLLSMSISLVLLQQTYSFLNSLDLTHDFLDKVIEHNEGRQISYMIFDKFIGQAGYQNYSDESIEFSRFTKTDIFPSHAFVFGEENKTTINSSKPETDVIHIRFETPKYGEFRDCKNTLLKPNTVYAMSFYIDKLSDLRCLGVPNKSNKRSSAVLAHRISDLQIEYAYKNLDAIAFCNAECISTLDKWTEVIAVRLFIKSLLCVNDAKDCDEYGNVLETKHTFELNNVY